MTTLEFILICAMFGMAGVQFLVQSGSVMLLKNSRLHIRSLIDELEIVEQEYSTYRESADGVIQALSDKLTKLEN